jgi:hypothetical protein
LLKAEQLFAADGTATAETERYFQKEAMLKVFGRTTSFNVQKVLWLLDELSLNSPMVNDIVVPSTMTFLQTSS